MQDAAQHEARVAAVALPFWEVLCPLSDSCSALTGILAGPATALQQLQYGTHPKVLSSRLLDLLLVQLALEHAAEVCIAVPRQRQQRCRS